MKIEILVPKSTNRHKLLNMAKKAINKMTDEELAYLVRDYILSEIEDKLSQDMPPNIILNVIKEIIDKEKLHIPIKITDTDIPGIHIF